MAGIGEDRQRAGEDAADRLDREEAPRSIASAIHIRRRLSLRRASSAWECRWVAVHTPEHEAVLRLGIGSRAVSASIAAAATSAA